MKPSVLVADSDATSRQILHMVLTAMGADVHFADSDEDAYRSYLESGHALLLIDVLLPRQGGLRLLERIRSSRDGHRVPVLMMGSITQDKEFRRQAIGDLKALDYLKKPFVLDALRSKLGQAFVAEEAVEPMPFFSPSRISNPFSLNEPPRKGSLEPTLFPRLLQSIAAHQVTGCLTLSRGRQKKIIFFRNGSINFALSNQLRETLSSYLLTHSKIDESTVRTAVDHMRRDGMKLGEYLIVNEILSAQEVFAAIRQNIREKILDALLWSNGAFQVTDYRDPPATLPGATLAVSEILWEAAQNTLPSSSLMQQLEPLRDLCLVRSDLGASDTQDPCLRGADLSLLRTLRAASGKSLGHMLQELKDEHSIRVLFYSLLRGLLQLHGDSCPNSIGSLTSKNASRMGSMRKQLSTLQGQNYFQVLGVPLGASDSNVREAYRNRAKDVHPDTLSPEDPPELLQVYTETFQRIREAYEGLKTSSKREQYLHYLEGNDRDLEQDQGSAVMQAEVHYQESQRFLKKRDWDAAADLLQQAVDLTPDEGDYVLHLGIARLHQASGGRADLLRIAEELLGRAKSLLSQSPEPCYFLGRAALLREDAGSAGNHFQTALNRDPNHMESQRELRLLRMRDGKKLNRPISSLFSKDPN